MAKKPQEGIQFTKEPYIEDVGPRKTKSIRFSMLSESDIYKAAEVQVFKGVYYDMTKKPIPNGLLDPRMVVFGIVGLKGMDWTSLIQGICKSKDPY